MPLRFVCLICFVVVGLAAFGRLRPSSVEACNPQRPDNYPVGGLAGWGRTSVGTVGGAYAQILQYNPYAPNDQPRFSAAWVGITRPSDHKWAQVGWVKYSASRRQTFLQYHDRYGVAKTYYQAAKPIGAFTYYSVLYNNIPNEFSFYVDGQYFFDDVAVWTPTTGDNAGEVNTKSYQFPGDLGGTFEKFQDVHLWYSNAWRDFDGTTYSTDLNNFYPFKNTSTLAMVVDLKCSSPN